MGRMNPDRLVARGFRPSERGSVLAGVLVLIFALMAAATLAALSGFTNLLTSSNLRAAAGAHATAESSINEALYRLTLLDSDAQAIVPALGDANWNVAIHHTTGDTNASDHTLSTIQPASDWPDQHDASIPAVTLEYKKDANGNVIYYNRAVTPGNTPFITVGLPSPVGPIVGNVYDALCQVPSVLGIQVGGILGLCAPTTVGAGYPVIQLRATGLDARGARREIVAEAARSVQYTVLAPLMAGGNVDFNGHGFIDGVNHDHRILLTGAGTTNAIFGDEEPETTGGNAILGLLSVLTIKDSPDDHALWAPILPLGWALQHAVGNLSLTLYFQYNPLVQSFQRPYNRQLASTDTTSAWVGVGQLANQVVGSLNVPGLGLLTAVQVGVWTGINYGYSAPIALSPAATVSNPPAVPSAAFWNQGIFSWRANNKNDAQYAGSLNFTTDMPAVNSVRECGPSAIGAQSHLTCRPAVLTTFPQFRDYLGIDAVKFQSLIQNPDTNRTQLDGGQPPLGFTYVDGDYTLGSGTASPGTDQFGVIYIHGNLTVQGLHTFKGHIFVDGNVTIATGARLIVLGALMAHGTYTHVGTGQTDLIYSREASLRGLLHARPWRVLSWADTAMQQ